MVRQLPLPFSRRGGKRRGAGRKPDGERAGVPHVRRAPLASRFPVHVTLRTVATGLRSRACFRSIVASLRRARRRQTIRVVEFSVQGNHLHLVVEAGDAAQLAKGIQGVAISIAKRLNALLGRRGPVFADRYHAHILRTPAEVANAVAYVRGNFAVHAARQGAVAVSPVDRCTSAALLEGRLTNDDGEREQGPPLVAEAKTWLLSVGWRRADSRRPAPCRRRVGDSCTARTSPRRRIFGDP